LPQNLPVTRVHFLCESTYTSFNKDLYRRACGSSRLAWSKGRHVHCESEKNWATFIL